MTKTIRRFAIVALTLASFSVFGAELAYKKFIAQNEKSHAKITAGMTKQQVLQAIGDVTSKVPDEDLKNPYKVETHSRDGVDYEILFFLTKVHPPFTKIMLNQASPVVLKNGVVIGSDWLAVNEARQ